MRTYKTFLVLFLLINLTACGPDEPPLPTFQSFTVIARDNNNYTFYRFGADLEELQRTDLNAALNFENPDRLYLSDNWVTVLTRNSENNFVFDVRAQSTTEFGSFIQEAACTVDDLYYDFGVSNGEYTLITGVTLDENFFPSSHFLSIYDRSTQSCTTLPYPIQETSPDFDRNPEIIIRDRIAYILMEDTDTRDYVLYTVDLQNKTFSDSINIRPNETFHILLDRFRLYLFYGDRTLEIRSLQDLSLESSSTFGFNLSLLGGGFMKNGRVLDNQVLVNFFNPQPTAIAFTPTILDLTTGEVVDQFPVFDVFNTAQAENQVNSFKVLATDLDSRLVICSGGITDANGDDQVLLLCNFEGEIIETIRLEQSEVYEVFMGL